ncbi:MAG: hypothetical protein RLZZ245_2888 [Verrucomicrobiota bacterium]
MMTGDPKIIPTVREPRAALSTLRTVPNLPTNPTPDDA